jgi:hypothetical protein
MALVFTQTDLDNLKAALVSGVLRVRIGDRDVQYRSQSDIMAAIKLVSQYLDGQATTSNTSPNLIKATFSKGSIE